MEIELDILKWLGLGAAWFASTYITYLFGRRNKNDNIQIEKRHALAEKLSASLQKDFHNRQVIIEQYNSNFDHMKDLSEAMYYFNKHETLYQELRQNIASLPDNIGQLQETNRRAAIYLDSSTTRAIDTYINNTTFSYETDGGIGLINTYAENFFATLLDSERSRLLEKSYKSAMYGLRKAVR